MIIHLTKELAPSATIVLTRILLIEVALRILIGANLKTLHLSGALDVSIGGPPEALAGLTSMLSDRGIEGSVIVIGTRRKDSPALVRVKASNKDVLLLPSSRLGARWNFSLRSLPAIVRFARKNDVIIIHGFYTFTLFAAIWLWPLYKKPIVLLPHGSLEPYQELTHKFRKRIFRSLIRNGERIDCIAVASEQEVHSVSANHWIRSDIVCTGLGIDVPAETETLIPFGENTKFLPYILFIGRIAEKKRLDLCIEAIRILSDIGNLITLVIAGEGNSSLRNRMILLTKEHSLEEVVHFVGQIDNDEKWELISNASLVILPSENENFAVAIAESLAMGTPVVVSTHVALAKVVEEYGAGVVINELAAVEVADAIRKVLLNREDMSRCALVAAETLSWRHVGEKWVEMLEKVIDGRRVV